MAAKIEDYAVIGNCETAALVGRDGSIDWLCLPRFDSAASFAALLGDESHGRWLIAPAEEITGISRAYRGSTLILETTFETAHGAVRVTDFMARSDGACDLFRRVTGLHGIVAMHAELCVRLDYGSTVPWVTRMKDGRIKYVAGPDRLILQTSVPFENEDMRSRAKFSVAGGDVQEFVLGWSNSFRAIPAAFDFPAVLKEVESRWSHWASRFPGAGEWSDIVLRSLITLKALTHFETGGIVPAGTTRRQPQLGLSLLLAA